MDFSGMTGQEIYEYLKSHPEEREQLFKQLPALANVYRVYESKEQYANGEASANDLLGSVGDNGATMSPEFEKWLDNEISRENTMQQQGYETQMRDTSILSAGSQLSQLGLSPSSVVNVGGAASGVNGAVASTSHMSTSSLRQQQRLNDYNNKIGLAKSLIGAAGQMASSGIYGAAIGAIRHSAQAVAAEAANSGLRALQAMRPEVRNQMMKDESWRYNNSHNELLK